MIDINELRRLAQAATPGGWYVARGNCVYGCKEVTDGEEEWHPVIACTDDDEISINFEGNANFIAAANPAVINELLDRLEAAEKSDAESLAMYRKARDERDAYKTAFEEWHQKTGWLQQGINDGSIPPTYLGWHRADVMADMLKSARRDYCVLEGYYTELAEKLAAVNHAVDEAYQRGYATGQEEVAAELEFAKQEIANLHDDISEWMDKCDALRDQVGAWIKANAPGGWIDALRAELEALKRREPVGEWVMNEWPKYLRIQCAEGYEAQAGARLFNHPVPPITTSVPEGWNLYMQPTPTSVPDRIEKAESGFNGMFLREAQAYQKGWNDCRAAMLAAAPEAKP